MYTVKEMSEQLQMSSHSIRYYCDQGLIPSLQRDHNNIRMFNDDAKLWLMNVKYMRNCGMSIEAIRNYVKLNEIGDSTVDERFDILLEQKEIIKKQMEELQETAKFLDSKMGFYKQTFKHIITKK